MKQGIYHGISNDEYHGGPGISKSQLDDIAISPAIYQWRKLAPVDNEKTKSLDMGTALHCLLLEPDEFDKRFIVAPEFNRRTNSGKAEEAEFILQCVGLKMTVMSSDEGRKLKLMRESVFAHPGARWLLEQEGDSEASIYWTDPETGELCRSRPDRMLRNHHFIVDVKKVADMQRFSRHIEEFRYHVQEAMYCDGYKIINGVAPRFAFLAVSESIDCGRYPVRLFVLDDDDHDAGYRIYRRDLQTFHQAKISNEWGLGFEMIQRPAWARNRDE
ncbi:PD-(D/E)XK nuclease-like domain-containing protein [Entomohabitans teleogrylli]|uniref:PD-(D/E)XK nuclease-like domain-containing protein n=1 Tax=Entomohabitans teleogrylli TaxID=1384589 RepID=UPI00073D1BD8|nr:PD-(D/E)XK nuclease-like domain-containing protein [Entomohabitans teleogrylli]